MTTTTRICLDVLKSARVRREEYVGPWLPDPVTDTAALAPDTQTELAHDVFDYSFAEVARALDRNEAACRQLAARARAHVRELRPAGAIPQHALPNNVDPKHAALLSAPQDDTTRASGQ